MHTVTINGREYLLVQSAARVDYDPCHGCALDRAGESCHATVSVIDPPDRCHTPYIYILNTPESIAAYAAERLS